MQHVDVNGLRIAYTDEGPPDGVPVVMLHGFPDGPFTFDHLAEAVVAAGHRVIRPSLRGYPPSTVPDDARTEVRDLVGDADGLVDALELDRPVLIGHDWGAVIGWATTTRRDQDRYRALVAMAVPPPPVQVAMLRSPVQLLRRSGYMWWMQVPGVHRVMPQIIDRLYDRWSPGWTVPADHLAQVHEVLDDPEAARAAATYYRGIVPAVLTGRHPDPSRAVPPIPVRYLHGAHDTCFPASAALRAQRLLPPGSVRVLARCGHFLHLERPEEVADDVVRFLARV